MKKGLMIGVVFCLMLIFSFVVYAIPQDCNSDVLDTKVAEMRKTVINEVDKLITESQKYLETKFVPMAFYYQKRLLTYGAIIISGCILLSIGLATFLSIKSYKHTIITLSQDMINIKNKMEEIDNKINLLNVPLPVMNKRGK